MKKSLSQQLEANPWLAILGQSHREKLLSTATAVHWPAQTPIFLEGEADPYFYLVLNGRVALDISVPSRGRVTILTVSKDDPFGWSSLLPSMKIKTATARTIQETDAVRFDANQLRELCEQDHELGYAIYRQLAEIIALRLSATSLQLLDMYATAAQGED